MKKYKIFEENSEDFEQGKLTGIVLTLVHPVSMYRDVVKKGKIRDLVDYDFEANHYANQVLLNPIHELSSKEEYEAGIKRGVIVGYVASALSLGTLNILFRKADKWIDNYLTQFSRFHPRCNDLDRI